MSITLLVELQPFSVPDYVIEVARPRRREEGLVETPKHALAELSAETLDHLCNEFRRQVFEKAGKGDPR